MSATDVETVTTVETTPVERQQSMMPAASTDLVDQQQREAGISALARMTDQEFDARLVALKLGMDRFRRLMHEVLTTGSDPSCDLMQIEGIGKPVFTLAAAEKTAFIARLVPTYILQRIGGIAFAEQELERKLSVPPQPSAAADLSPAVLYMVRTQIHMGNSEGPVIAEGVGSCNSHEVKYRYRNSLRKCPDCGFGGALLESKNVAKSGPFKGQKPWFCWSKKGGCGHEFAPNDKRIIDQPRGREDNPDPLDLDNTILKMAKKRSFVDAVKTATCASGMVTQDLEENFAQAKPADPTLELRDRILARARKLEWKKLGEIFHVVRVATGKTVGLKAQFDKLSKEDLELVWEHMPIPADELAAAADEDIAAHTAEGEDIPSLAEVMGNDSPGGETSSLPQEGLGL